MQKSDFTIKGLKAHNGPDSLCYTCTIHLNGKKVAEAYNDGNGGCTMIQWYDHTAGDAAEKWAREQPAREWNYDGHKGTSPFSLDDMIDSIVFAIMDEREAARFEKRLAKFAQTETLFTLKGDAADAWRRLKGGPLSEKSKAWVMKKYGDKVERFYGEQVAA